MMERLLWVLKDNLRAAQLGLAGEKSINAPIHNDAEVGEWQVHLVDRSPSPEAIVLDQDDCIEYDEGGTDCSFTSYSQCDLRIAGFGENELFHPD